jgi:signal transduction histidine kinase
MDKTEGKLIITTYSMDNNVCLSIEDNGKGIEEEHVSKLFDPFFTGKVRGTGLGLTATRNIISSHNGDIKVNSLVGEGTTFILSFKLPS